MHTAFGCTEEMANLITAQHAKLSDGDDEAEELARDARVQFHLETKPLER
jgi:hypothetical protein